MVNCPTFLRAAPSPSPSAGLAVTGLAALATGHHCIEECNKLVARGAQRRPSVARNVLLGKVAMMAILLIPGHREGEQVSAIRDSLHLQIIDFFLLLQTESKTLPSLAATRPDKKPLKIKVFF